MRASFNPRGSVDESTFDATMIDGMTQVAHLSDLHLLEEGHEARRGEARRRLKYISLGRPYDPRARRKRAAEALAASKRSGADHLVLTGDLTEDGLEAQFAILAELLDASGWAPQRVTLIPGNHDAYTSGEAWALALAGPLAPYRATSTLGAPVRLPGLMILPLSTSLAQHYTRSSGALAAGALAGVEAAAAESRRSGEALVLAMHHPPRRNPLPPLQWIDGFRDHAALGALLAAHDHAHVLHGHTHLATDHAVRPGAAPRIFATEAVVDGTTPLRLYRARHGRLWPEGRVEMAHLTVAPA
jgi:3',5'-cyclic-AMP phosphodiesterase